MMKILKWRLSSLPTAEELRQLVNDKIITQEEARSILFSEEEKDERSIKSLQEEIKFLRQLVESLSSRPEKIVEIIKTVEVPFSNRKWFEPYTSWCQSSGPMVYYSADGTSTASGGGTGGSGSNVQLNSGTTSSTDFSNIKTF